MLIHARPMARYLKHMTPECRHGGVELVCHGFITLTTSEVEIECPNASKYALGMHRLVRWFVGTVASLLGLSLLLVRWGFWASESTVVEDAQGMRAVLIAIQTEPAVLVYGAIVFLLLVGFALLITTSKWKKWVTGH